MNKDDIAWYNIYNIDHGEHFFHISEIVKPVRQTGYPYFTWNGMIIKYGTWTIVAEYNNKTMEITLITPRAFGS